RSAASTDIRETGEAGLPGWAPVIELDHQRDGVVTGRQPTVYAGGCRRRCVNTVDPGNAPAWLVAGPRRGVLAAHGLCAGCRVRRGPPSNRSCRGGRSFACCPSVAPT